MLQTVDGGETWSLVTQPCPPALGPAVFSLPDATFGRVACANEGGNAMFTYQLFGTGDGGEHWEALAPVVGPNRRGPTPTGLSFADHDHGWMSTFHTGFGSLWVSVQPPS